MKKIQFLAFLILIAGCQQKDQIKSMGTIEKLDESLDNIIAGDAKAEVIAEGFDWSEGPLWIEKHNMLLFSDVPANTIYKWTEERGAEVYLTPSGYTGSVKRGGETGSNGLLLDAAGNLVLCQHGNRQMARMNAPLDNPKPEFTTLADRYNGMRLNSPNDAVYNKEGELFFTDPPYGLEKQAEDSTKETPWQGVYKVKTDGTVILLTDSITRPNGIAFFPGEKRLLVANSDPSKPNWYVYDISGDSLTNGKIFYSAAGHDRSWRGLPDGFKIDKNGHVIATGPGGVWIFDSEGKVLGRVRLDNPTSNIALSPDEKTVYITNDMYVLRLQMK